MNDKFYNQSQDKNKYKLKIINQRRYVDKYTRYS